MRRCPSGPSSRESPSRGNPRDAPRGGRAAAHHHRRQPCLPARPAGRLLGQPLKVTARLPGGRTWCPTPSPRLQTWTTGSGALARRVGAVGIHADIAVPRYWEISEIGRVIDDRFAYISESTGQVTSGPEGNSSGSPCGTERAWTGTRRTPRWRGGRAAQGAAWDHRRSAPLRTHPATDRGRNPAACPARQHRHRRCRGSRREVDHPDNTRHVRTVEPTGPDHVFIVVYDGVFYAEPSQPPHCSRTARP